MPEPVLTTDSLTVELDGNVIIQNLGFALPKGENLAIVGPNGSGKTVLLKTLLGMFPYKGTVSWGPDVRIGYVPQKIDADRHLPLNFKNLFAAKRDILKLSKSALAESVKVVGLASETLETPVGHLSGGQFQKCLIAFALIGNPSLLILDEPTASIDQPNEERLYELVHRLQEKYALTVILVSHDLSVVYRYATMVLCLNKHNLCFGRPQEILTPEMLAQLYGMPVSYYRHIHKETGNG